MKQILLWALLLLPLCVNAQARKYEKQDFPHPYEFTLIDSVIGSRAELFVRANEWMIKTYPSIKTVLQFSDKETGKIIGKGAMMSDWRYDGRKMQEYIHYTISMDIKDGKYRCVLTEFNSGGSDLSPISKGELNNDKPSKKMPSADDIWAQIKSATMEQSKALLASLQKAMQQHSDF